MPLKLMGRTEAMSSKRQFPGNAIILLVSEVLRRLSKQSYFRAARTLLFSLYQQREMLQLEALSPEAAQSRLRKIGLNPHWVFTDFDEVVIEQSSQHLWAKTIIQLKKVAVPRIVLKYVRHYKWKENLFELNKIFSYSDGLDQLKNHVIPVLRLNKNIMITLDEIRDAKIGSENSLKKILHKFFLPTINLVIVSSNCGIVIKLFLDREAIRKRFRQNNIVIRAIVANKMRFDEEGNIRGLSHRENIIDVNTKKNYIPEDNTVLVDERDSHLRRSHTHVIFVPLGIKKIKEKN
jgi:hypothetical protein